MQSLLENDPQKLAKVKRELTAAEKAERRELKVSKKSTFRYKEVFIIARSLTCPQWALTMSFVDVVIASWYKRGDKQ